MDSARLWFGFRGRINRAKYWLVTAINFLVVFGLLFLVYATGSRLLLTVAGTGCLAVVVSGLAIAVKRLHDRGKSAWWILFFFALPSILQGFRQVLMQVPEPTALILAIACALVAAVISIWALVELGFLRGTPGPNRYGPDPLALP